MRKYLCILLGLMLLFGCRDQKKVEDTKENGFGTFSFQDYPKEVEMDTLVLPIVKGWPEYMAMENSFAVLKRATNLEDVKLAIDDLIEKEEALSEGDYPTEFDKLQIKGRQRVFRTFLLKVKANLVDSRDIHEGMEQMVIAYNAFKNQFNILSNKTLNAKLILDGE